MLEETSIVGSATAYPEVFNGSGSTSSSVLAPSSVVAVPSGWMLEEDNGVVSVTAYHEVFHGSGSKSFSVPAPSSTVAVPAPGRMVEENNGAVSVTAYPEACHGSGNKPPSSALLPSYGQAVAAPGPASGRMLEDNGTVPVTAYPEEGHISGKKSSSPPSTAVVAPAGRSLEDYAKEWAARKAASGAPLHHCVLPFLTGAPKAVSFSAPDGSIRLWLFQHFFESLFSWNGLCLLWVG
jgi:histone-lysine N-methyltransferase SETD2